MGSENAFESMILLEIKRDFRYSNAMAVATVNNHISNNADGVPIIAGTRFKVVHLIMAAKAYGWDAEELHIQYPHLSMAEIHSALAYYWDNREAIEEDIVRRDKNAERIKQETKSNSIRPLLEKKGLL